MAVPVEAYNETRIVHLSLRHACERDAALRRDGERLAASSSGVREVARVRRASAPGPLRGRSPGALAPAPPIANSAALR